MLKGDKINLRTVRGRDLETFLDLSSDIAARGSHYPLNLQTETSIKARFDKDGFWGEDSGLMLIVDKQTDRILGSIVHFKPVHYYNCVEIGYIVYDPNQRGKGIVTEGLKLFTQYLFDLKPIYRIQIQVEPANTASRRVAEKCGFEHEGTARKAFISKGKPMDIDVFSLIRVEDEVSG
jgi:ribosomal-protein-alanine N-acetyltransferase